VKAIQPKIVLLAAIATLLSGCGSSSPNASPTASRERPKLVIASGRHFLDARGQSLLLHGINVVNKSKAEGYTAKIEPSDMAAIRSWGMNCIRLGVIWDGLEPQPGRIDEEYLERVARIVGWAKAAGLYVLLDMHQDLFSVKFSDGAPAWATLDEGKPYTPTAVWSDAYYTSEAVQTALDHFWANSPAPDGVGLQDHYARAWRRVAERFRDEPFVLGYDLMNEPFPGRDAARTQQAMLTKLAELLRSRLGEQSPTSEELVAMAFTAEGRDQIAQWLGDLELYQAMLAAGTPIMQEFERTRLMPMYDRVRQSIRQFDPHHLIFLEPSMSANLGIPSAITPLLDEHGRRDPQQAYAPHAYDIVIDTPQAGLKSSNARIELIFRRHDETAARLKMPMLVGEWGAYYQDPSAVAAAQFVIRQLDALQCGDTYWDYNREFAESPLRQAIQRPARP